MLDSLPLTNESPTTSTPLPIARIPASTPPVELALLSNLVNRHGCITGATGTGKTVTLQVIAQALAVDNAAPFYLAGHETTANALTWTLFLLAAQPELQEELAAEARAAMEGGEEAGPLTDRLPRLRLFLMESLRLYPPVPRFDRQALAADRIGEVEVAPGDIVSIWPWVIHRHRRLWSDPDRFDHTRFAPEARARLHRFQYLPFGGGPPINVGMRFATVEALLILARWLETRRFSVPAGWRPDPVGSVTLRPRGGMLLRAEPV